MTTHEGLLKVDNYSKDNKWIYVGGDSGRHLRYWKLVCKSKGWNKTPKHKM